MKKGDEVSAIDEDFFGKIEKIEGNLVSFTDQFGFLQKIEKHKLIIRNSNIYENINIEKKPEPKKIISKKHDKNPLILDLHFEKIGIQNENSDSFERLFIQKEKLLETLNFCRKNRLKKLEIIHGIGDGILQNMVTEILDSQTGLNYYHNAVLKDQSGSILVEFA